jgi:hypothetical protein
MEKQRHVEADPRSDPMFGVLDKREKGGVL